MKGVPRSKSEWLRRTASHRLSRNRHEDSYPLLPESLEYPLLDKTRGWHGGSRGHSNPFGRSLEKQKQRPATLDWRAHLSTESGAQNLVDFEAA